MTNTPSTEREQRIFRVYIRAGIEQVWEAIVDPAWNGRYGYRAATQYDALTPGSRMRVLATDEMRSFGAPEVMIEGEVLEADPPRRLVQTYKMHFDPAQIAEPFTTVTYELVADGDLCRLTLVHDVTGAPAHGATIFNDSPIDEGGGGWAWILSDLKTLLESGAVAAS